MTEKEKLTLIINEMNLYFKQRQKECNTKDLYKDWKSGLFTFDKIMLKLTKTYKDDFIFEINYALRYKTNIHLPLMPLKFITPIQFIKNGKVFFVTETIEFAHNYKLKNIYYKLEN